MIFTPSLRKDSRGIALLIAIVVSAIVLSLGLSISIITSRSISISGGVRESQLAYYAAEAGSECARYWGTKSRHNFSATQNFTISCNNNEFTWNNQQGPYEFEFGHNYEIDGVPYTYPYYSTVSVTRKGGIFNVDIDAKGYNTADLTASRRFEREQELNARGLCAYRPDIMLVLDVSTSLDSEEFTQAETAVSTFINTLNPSDLRVHMGVTVFGTKAEVVQSLTGDKNDVLDAVEDLEGYHETSIGGSTNTVDGLRFSRYELSNRKSPLASLPYCPIPGAPNRALVFFNTNQVLVGNNIFDSLLPAPQIPVGNYDIYASSCDEYPTRVTVDQDNESYRLRVFNTSGAPNPFYLSGYTEDVADLVTFAATTTLVGDNVFLNQIARKFQSQHFPDGGSIVAVCAAFENLDGLTDFDFPSVFDPDDRLDSQSPDYMILITDGGTKYSYNCRGSGVAQGGAAGNPAALRSTALEADAARAAGIDIFTIGVGTEDQTCSGYDGKTFSSCGDYLNREVASFAEPENLASDPDGNAFYFNVDSFTELDEALREIVNCVHPLSD